MKATILTSSFLATALLVFGVGAAAQRSSVNQTQQDQTTQSQSQSGTMGGGMMGEGAMGGGMMGQGMGQGQGQGQGRGMMGNGASMMSMMGQMTTHHQQMSALMTQLMQNMTAIINEKDPVALKSKLAEHQALLNQMHSQMMQQGNVMKRMSGQISSNCPAAAAGNNSNSPEK
jgi:hypothetical protein